MSELEIAFHKRWRGLVEPVEGLVVSVPVLVDAECMHKHGPELQETLRDLCDDGRVRDLPALFQKVLGFAHDAFAHEPAGASVYLPEGSETVQATFGLKARGADGLTMLVWDVPNVALDRPDTRAGAWAYPPKDKFDRLLRHTKVPIGILTNRREFRLFYAPHAESTGIVTFRVADMLQTSGREILDAFVMLLASRRFFGVAKDRQLPALLAESRLRQANVTNALADQVLEALAILLRGFEAASARDGDTLLREAVETGRAYPALLTVLLRLVFLLYAEDLSLLPVEHPHYAEHLSLLAMHARLQADAASFPDTMPRRFGAYPRLLALFRAVYFGIRHGELSIPPRRGALFDPAEYPFLEGWGPAGGAPTGDEDRANVHVPTVDDDTIFRVLDRLLILDGERLSYRALDVEQIGSVYEALMGFAVERTLGAAECIKPHGVWVSGADLVALAPRDRTRFLEEHALAPKKDVAKVAAALGSAKNEAEAIAAIAPLRRARVEQRVTGSLVLQPGPERRRTSSHYTPRSLSEPIVRRTLEPLLLTMGETPPSARILELKVCDPAMGSGAFLVAACRFLAGELVAAWAREKQTDALAKEHGNVFLFAKRLIAQRCLYGVDKNPLAVGLAKLSLWLETLAKDEPFTFLDHAMKHGDSLVGLSLDQVRAFHWTPEDQVDLASREIDAALGEAVRARQEILDLAKGEDPLHAYVREKEQLLFEAHDTLARARLLADLVVGAFFAHDKPKDREAERVRRLDRALAWLRDGGPAPDELVEMQRSLSVPAFHWMIEFPEVFYAERSDPLEQDRKNRVAMMDAFVGNPPFMRGLDISGRLGNEYMAWGREVLGCANAKADLSAYFFLRAGSLIGAHGTIGLVATNTICQGDTREAGLAPMIAAGFTIYDATKSMAWPGAAAVAVSVVHLARGTPTATCGELRIDGGKVPAINSHLRPRPERGKPQELASNAGSAFQGAIIQGAGFVLKPEERDELIRSDSRNALRIQPYVGGDDVNSRADPAPPKFVVNFGDASLGEASAWPMLLELVRTRVKPDRDSLRDDQATARAAKAKWWQFWAPRRERFAALAALPRCIVRSLTSKHHVFDFRPASGVTFDQTLIVFLLPTNAAFGVLSSTVHQAWVRAHGATLEDRQRYSISDCFETFPFPEPLPPPLELAGERLYETRAAYMKKHQRGLTETYNRLKDPDDHDAEVEELRRLSEEVDRAVLDAYGWRDVEVPPFAAPEGDPARARFEDEVIDRLFALNAERAEKERVLGAGAAHGGKRKAASGRTAAAKKSSRKSSTRGGPGQGGLPGLD